MQAEGEAQPSGLGYAVPVHEPKERKREVIGRRGSGKGKEGAEKGIRFGKVGKR